MTATEDDFKTLVLKSKALVDAVTFDDSGAMVADQWMGGNGGLISRETIVAVDELRKQIEKIERAAT